MIEKSLRHFITLGGLALGGVALIWGVSSLHSIFQKEKVDALQELERNKLTLEEFSSKSLRLILRQQLLISRNAILFTANDPLAIDPGYLLFDKGQQKLPRIARFLPESSDLSSQDLYEQIYNADPIDLIVDNLSSWSQQRSHYSNIKLAVENSDMDEIRSSFRSIRDLRARYPMDARIEIPFMLAVIEFLVNNSKPSKNLIRGALRGGTIVDQENGRYGLQRSLLLNRNRFTLPEYNFLRDKIFYLSRFAGAKYDDFLTRSKDKRNSFGLSVESILEPSLLFGGTWYVERDGNLLIGQRVKLEEVLKEVRDEMMLLGLADDGVKLALQSAVGERTRLGDIRFSITPPNQKEITSSIYEHYWVKTTLLAVLLFFVAAIVSLMLLIQKRQQRYLSLKADFMAAVTHELRTPLASMRLMAETLHRRLQGEEKAKDYPQRIIRDVDNLGQLVDNILSFNRFSSGNWQTHSEFLSLNEMIIPLAKELEPVYGKNIQIEFTSTVKIFADGELMKILFSNLISNACKYNFHEVVTIVVECQKNSNVAILFRDNGVGIEKNQWDNVFKEFVRLSTNKESNIRGVGLGLALCRQIMHMHNGEISVVDSLGEGTTLKLVFPRGEIDD